MLWNVTGNGTMYAVLVSHTGGRGKGEGGRGGVKIPPGWELNLPQPTSSVSCAIGIHRYIHTPAKADSGEIDIVINYLLW